MVRKKTIEKYQKEVLHRKRREWERSVAQDSCTRMAGSAYIRGRPTKIVLINHDTRVISEGVRFWFHENCLRTDDTEWDYESIEGIELE